MLNGAVVPVTGGKKGIVRFDVGEELVVASFLVGSEVRLARLSGGETVYYDSPLTLTDPEFPD